LSVIQLCDHYEKTAAKAAGFMYEGRATA